MSAADELRRELLQTALRDPAALERALQLAEQAYGWLGEDGSGRLLALPAPAPAVPPGSGAAPPGSGAGAGDPATPRRRRTTRVMPDPAAAPAPAPPARAPRPDAWTEAEEDLLRQLYPGGAPRDDILAALPGRSWGTIGVKASKLGLHRPRGGTVPEELPIVATARRAAEWLSARGLGEVTCDEYGVFWRHDTGDGDEAEQLTPRQVIRLADSQLGSPGFTDGADLAGGPHQSSLGGVI